MFNEFKPYPHYQAPPGHWIPAPPAHWRVLPGTSVLKPVRERNKDLRETTVLSLSYGKVVVKGEDQLTGLVPESFESYQVLEPGDIVVRPTDLQNDKTSVRVGSVQDRGIITSAYLGFRAVGVDAAFAAAYLAALDSLKVFYGMGSGLRQNLDLKDFKRLPFLVPPSGEQQAIVNYLAHAGERIDRAVVGKQKLIALLAEQKQMVIHQAVTRGIDHSAPLKPSGMPWLPDLPAHWQIVPVRRLLRAISRPVTNHSLPRASMTRARGLVPTDSMNSNVKRGDGHDNVQACESGDFVLNKYRAHLGLFASVATPCIVTRNYSVFRAVTEFDHQYLEALFRDFSYSDAFRINARGVGDGMSPLYTNTLYRIPVCIPPLEEQRKIVALVNKVTNDFNQLAETTAREIALMREFRTRLTTDVVTGQFDVRGIASTLSLLNEAGTASLGAQEAREEFDAGETYWKELHDK